MSLTSDGAGPEWAAPWSVDRGTDRVRQLFSASFDGEPTDAASSPGRVTIIGDHTDYSAGLALSTVIPFRTYVAVRARDDEALRVVSAQGDAFDGPGARWEGAVGALAPGEVEGWPAYVAGVIWALRERGYPATGMDIAIDSCVPTFGGLGSSAALTTAVGHACDTAWGLALDTDDGAIELAEACWEAERTFVGFPCGRLDPHTVVRCPEGSALRLDFATVPPETRPYPLYFPEYGLRLLVVDTRERQPDRVEEFIRRSADAARATGQLEVVSLREVAEHDGAEEALELIGDPVLRARARHIVTEDRRVHDVAAALGGLGPAHERFLDIGAAMLASHRSLRGDYAASTPAVDAVVDAAFAAGAIGARLIGVGFGGTVLALVRATDVENVAARVDEVLLRAGHARPRFLVV